MSDDEPLSRKELAKRLRKEAYQRAKARRDADPRYIAMKEAAKVQRREAYQEAKKRRQAGQADREARDAARRAEELEAKREEHDLELRQLLWTPGKGRFDEN